MTRRLWRWPWRPSSRPTLPTTERPDCPALLLKGAYDVDTIDKAWTTFFTVSQVCIGLADETSCDFEDPTEPFELLADGSVVVMMSATWDEDVFDGGGWVSNEDEDGLEVPITFAGFMLEEDRLTAIDGHGSILSFDAKSELGQALIVGGFVRHGETGLRVPVDPVLQGLILAELQDRRWEIEWVAMWAKIRAREEKRAEIIKGMVECFAPR